ncbi:hypothetical protein [Clostridium sp. SM-530-WT-3G]|uniref:hypothetical protein n=1 Tax=Clostridium sp. SM-530-WT-3G TaxID=2725303 RepID=UPI00145D6CD9|nr:hypothetical protein [Clostridium sp. SM-530-WT-3G]NME81891.1 hypothetical protein [Clostridium sp. SM-530-WT-3G]
MIISNEKQKNAKIILSLSINRITQESKFNVKINDKFIDDISANLALNKFLINMSKEGKKKLISLKEDNEFMCICDSTVNDYNDEAILKEVNLLERLKLLEEYYNIKFKLPDEITQNDYENMFILEKVMNNEVIEGTYDEIMLKIEINREKKQAEKLSEDEIKIDFCCYNEKILLFGQTITFKKKLISLYSAVIENFDRVLNKIKYADDGDVIKVICKPVDTKNNKVEVRYVYK